MFRDRGLLIGTLLTDAVPSQRQWQRSGCNAAIVDGSSRPPAYARQWAIADHPTVPGVQPDGRLFTMCFGTGQPYDERLVARLAKAFALVHRHHRDVLVHIDQLAGQWSEEELRSYVRTARPDLVTFSQRRFRAPAIYDSLAIYRKVALEGYDGSGSSPIAFGHYGAACITDELSDAELRLDCFAAWTMGARWISLFRWSDAAAARLARIARESARLSPFLVRLTSTDVRTAHFRHRPRHLPVRDPFAGPYIDDISGSDIVIGYFRPTADLPGLKHAKPFMLLNGDIAAAAQRITVSLHRLGAPNRLLRVNRDTGRLEQIPLHDSGRTDEFTVPIEAGAADLFFLTTGPTYDEPPVVTASVDRRTLRPGEVAAINVTATNSTDDQPMPDVQARLLAPPGWSSEPDGSIGMGDLAAGTTGTTSWRVTAPTSSTAGVYPVTVEITYRYGPGTGVRGGTRTNIRIPVPYNSLSDDFGNVAITDDSVPGQGNIDGEGNSYSALALSVAGLTPGSTVTAAGISFSWPDFAAGRPDNAVAAGQAFMVGESGTTLGFLGCCTNGSTGGAGRIVYADGSEQSYELSFPDWYGTPPAGAQVVARMAYRNTRAGVDGSPVQVYAATVDIDPTKTVDTVVLPDIEAISAGPTMHIFAMGVA